MVKGFKCASARERALVRSRMMITYRLVWRRGSAAGSRIMPDDVLDGRGFTVRGIETASGFSRGRSQFCYVSYLTYQARSAPSRFLRHRFTFFFVFLYALVGFNLAQHSESMSAFKR
jgi:hypothetical protein